VVKKKFIVDTGDAMSIDRIVEAALLKDSTIPSHSQRKDNVKRNLISMQNQM
jgi:hypothetical protein